MISRLAPLLYLLLLVLAVPWYWPRDNTLVWFGVPAWVCIATLVSVAASILTAVLMGRAWPGEVDDDD